VDSQVFTVSKSPKKREKEIEKKVEMGFKRKESLKINRKIQ